MTGSKVSQEQKRAEIWRVAWICYCGEILQSGFKVTLFLAYGGINDNFPTWLDGPQLVSTVTVTIKNIWRSLSEIIIFK